MQRVLLDLGILLSRDVLLAFLLAACVGLLLWRGSGRGPSLSTGWPRFALPVFGAALALAFAGVGGWYLGRDGFAGEVEPLVSSLSWLLQDGTHELYHPLDAPNQYSLLYGPSVFLTNGLFLRILGPTLLSAKLASVLAGIGSVLLIFAATARSWRDPLGWAAAGCAVLLLWAHGFGIYLVRPDALLVLAVALAVFLLERGRTPLAALGLAAVLGFAINLKIHGGFYFLPILFLWLRSRGVRSLAAVLLITTGLVLLPFALHPRISAENYFAWLLNASHHGLDLGEFHLISRFLFLLLLPALVLAVRAPADPRAWAPHRGILWALGAALAPVLVAAAKPGAGPVHLLPFVPVAVYVPVRIWRQMKQGGLVAAVHRPHLAGAVLTGAAVTLVLAGGVSGYRATRLVSWQMDQEAGLAGEVQGIIAAYPDLDIGMACGGENASFRHTWVRPLLVFADNPLLVDPIAVMDCRLAGRELPEATFAALADGVIDLWLVPRTESPFQKENWYEPHEPVFPSSFQAEFEDHYARRRSTPNFDLWFFKRLPDGLPARPDWATMQQPSAGEVLAP